MIIDLVSPQLFTSTVKTMKTPCFEFFSSLFVQPMYDSILLEQSMIYNRRKDEFNLRDRLAIIDSEEERNILADEGLYGQL